METGCFVLDLVEYVRWQGFQYVDAAFQCDLTNAVPQVPHVAYLSAILERCVICGGKKVAFEAAVPQEHTNLGFKIESAVISSDSPVILNWRDTVATTIIELDPSALCKDAASATFCLT